MDTTAAVKNAGIRRVDTAKSHYYTINGRRAVGVTTALNALPKPMLVRWAARTVAEHVADHLDTVGAMLVEGGRQPTIDYLSGLPNQVRDSAAERGTEVHDLVFRLAAGDAVDVPHDVAPYVRGALRYLDDYQPEPVLAETVVASYEHLYAGQLDSIQRINQRGTVQVDWKTGRGVYGEHALQLAAYRFAEVYLDAEGTEHDMPEIDGNYILHIKPDDYELIPVQAEAEQHDIFLGVLDMYRRAVQSDKLKKLIGTPLPKPSAVAA
ncbi:hypothetical protein M8C13_04405 [Crossiella sp. SN42]|uniref:hypothetical protein n=1 Tax=Crossiella sp. SN42 TaxID=2944808 RepID=UPI00207C7FC2|nr:hypothetical protein [Crossiella sp. SN42]MCO1575000.1 hypothetical protein [Crossiella sp. SN42]